MKDGGMLPSLAMASHVLSATIPSRSMFVNLDRYSTNCAHMVGSRSLLSNFPTYMGLPPIASTTCGLESVLYHRSSNLCELGRNLELRRTWALVENHSIDALQFLEGCMMYDERLITAGVLIAGCTRPLGSL